MAGPSPREPKIVHARDATGRPICGAPRRHAKGPCGQWAQISYENGRCRTHSGGESAGRPVTTALGSKIPGRLGDIVQSVVGHPDLPDMGKGLALLYAAVQRSGELVQELDTPKFRERAVSLFEAWQGADEETKYMALQRLEEHLRRGAEEAHAVEVFQRSSRDFGQAQKAYWEIALSHRHALSAKAAATVQIRLMTLARKYMAPDAFRQFLLEGEQVFFGPGPNQVDFTKMGKELDSVVSG